MMLVMVGNKLMKVVEPAHCCLLHSLTQSLYIYLDVTYSSVYLNCTVFTRLSSGLLRLDVNVTKLILTSASVSEPVLSLWGWEVNFAAPQKLCFVDVSI